MAANLIQGPIGAVAGLRAPDQPVHGLNSDRKHGGSANREESSSQRGAEAPLQVIAQQQPKGAANGGRSDG